MIILIRTTSELLMIKDKKCWFLTNSRPKSPIARLPSVLPHRQTYQPSDCDPTVKGQHNAETERHSGFLFYDISVNGMWSALSFSLSLEMSLTVIFSLAQ